MNPVIHRFPRVASTQDEARRLLGTGRARAGHVVVADEQTAGRGRFGRTWCSPRGGLYATYIVAHRPLLSLEAAVALSEVLEGAGLSVGLKWPNDVLVGEAKLAGILIEAIDGIALVGIGLNLVDAPIETATCLAACDCPTRKGDLIGSLWRALQRARSDEEILTEYRRRSATLGRRVRIERAAGGSIEGEAVDVDEAGRLCLDTSTGRRVVSTGECRHAAAD